MTGTVFEIQRFAIHDGPGIRTTVFLKGCPLRCLWCHNPEGVSGEPALSFVASKCIGCRYCLRACERGAHVMQDGAHTLDRGKCVACGACAVECYAEALELVGWPMTVEEVMAEVRADKPFYDQSGGGMTISGGEPLQQIDFTETLLKAAAEEGIHRCVETCGQADWTRVERIRGLVDLFLYDIKETDPARHAEFTGVSNERILDNLRRLHGAGAAIRLRLPLIPGVNARDDHLRAVGALCRELPGIEGVEIMAYHRLGESKRERLGSPPGELADLDAPGADAVAAWKDLLREAGARVIDG